MSHEESDQFCNDVDLAYISPDSRELQERDERVMVLTPWTVQNICFEVIKNYMQANTPQSQGFKFSQKYDPDDVVSGIALEIAYHYKDAVIQKRPGIYVSRGEASYKFPTLNQQLDGNPRLSQKSKYALVEMPVNVAVVATNVGFAEQLAEYVFKIFLHFQEQIRNDFCLRQLKLVSLAAPMLYLESKDHFVVNVQLLSVFDMGAVITGDDLKLKTVAYTIFTNCLEQPLTLQ